MLLQQLHLVNTDISIKPQKSTIVYHTGSTIQFVDLQLVNTKNKSEKSVSSPLSLIEKNVRSLAK